MMSLLLAVAAAAALQWVGWWLLAVIAMVWGGHLRAVRWPALRVSAVVAVLAVLQFGLLAWRGAPLSRVGEVVAGVVDLPAPVVWLAAVLLPALVALTAAAIGAAVGRRVLFG